MKNETNVSDRKEAEATQTELDGVVLNVELTLISIIQGVGLYFLTDNSRAVLVERQWAYLPYVLTGLFSIFLFWSRSLIHTLTVIRWPLEFTHNFLYIACTLMEAVTFTQVNHAENWFFCYAVLSVLVWLLFVCDLRLIHRRIRDSAGHFGSRLYPIVEKDQWTNIKFLVPFTILFNGAAWYCLHRWPAFFIAKNGHLIWAILQCASVFGYLVYGVFFFQKLTPLIAKTRKEWRDDVLE
ncbi:MAG: hypothetical protein U1F57_03810 [bacterium]